MEANVGKLGGHEKQGNGANPGKGQKGKTGKKGEIAAEPRHTAASTARPRAPR
jgi:hypothetical protein